MTTLPDLSPYIQQFIASLPSIHIEKLGRELTAQEKQQALLLYGITIATNPPLADHYYAMSPADIIKEIVEGMVIVQQGFEASGAESLHEFAEKVEDEWKKQNE